MEEDGDCRAEEGEAAIWDVLLHLLTCWLYLNLERFRVPTDCMFQQGLGSSPQSMLLPVAAAVSDCMANACLSACMH